MIFLSSNTTICFVITRRFVSRDINFGFFFFGVGATMFFINLITVINAINLIATLNVNVQIPMAGYYTSLICSVILMTYSLYNIYNE